MIHYIDMVTRQTHRYLQAGIVGVVLAVMMSMSNLHLTGAVFGGGTVQQGIAAASSVGGLATGSINETIGRIIIAILSVTTTIAVLTIVIAGMYLILSLGDEGQKDKAKKIIQYTVVGLIVILLAQIIIDFVFQLFFFNNPGGAAAIVIDVIVRLLKAVLDIVTTIGVVMIVIAGLYLILSNGDEGQKDKAKKIILYTIIGIVVILLARVIIVFFNNLFG